jgi:hypothetical protein
MFHALALLFFTAAVTTPGRLSAANGMRECAAARS